MREDRHSKAARLLVGGAVSVLEVTQHRCTASVKGDTATHEVTFDGDRWSCDCAAVGPCSHALAVARVVVVRSELAVIERRTRQDYPPDAIEAALAELKGDR
jgi:hypothetical protein